MMPKIISPYAANSIQSALGKISFTADAWTDPNMRSFLAVTAHWIQTTPVQTPHGVQYELTLRSSLVAFHQVPGRHTGEHLSQAFLHVLDCIGITEKVSCLLGVGVSDRQ